jgi:magnesium transporter
MPALAREGGIVPAPQDLLDRIRTRLDESFAGIGQVVGDLPAPDVADLINQLKIHEAAAVFTMLPVARAVEVLDQPTLWRRSEIIAKLPPERASRILEDLAADERAAVVRDMGDHARRRLLPKLSSEMRAEVETLLLYSPRSAGGIMTTEFVDLLPDMKVRDALKHIRVVARQKEAIYSCYVLEAETRRLLGALSLRDLIMAELDQPVSEVMRRRPVAVHVQDDQELVASLIAKYNLLAVPVLEADGRVVGFVTVDDVIDVLVEEGTEDVLKMAAIEAGALDRPYFDNPVLSVVRRRIGWLLLLFVAETFTGTVLRHFESELAAVVALSFFIPLLIGTGGNAGAQTVTTIIRSMALGEIRMADAWRVFLREATTGLTVGLLLGVVAFGRALLWGAQLPLAVTVSVTILAVCTWSTTIGSLVPLAAQRFRVDPAVLSAPLITTLVDATGLVIYFRIAKAILGL